MNGKRYSVASNHPLSTRAGLEILEKGGNAYDALLAVSSVLTVVQPHLNGLGGDFFAVVDDHGLKAINGSGFSSALASIELFKGRGFSEIPKFGPLSSLTVPGLVSSWELISVRATMKLPDLFRRAITYATGGFRVQRSLSEAVKRYSFGDEDWKRAYGDIRENSQLVQKDLGRTLETVSSDSGHSFYHGEIARAIEDDMIAKGGLIRFDDLDSYSAAWEEPLSTAYRNYRVYTTPPNSQGATILFWMNMLNRFKFDAIDREYFSKLLQTMQIAYDYRARYIGDPSTVKIPPTILSPDYEYSPLLRPERVEKSFSDTTAFSVYDGEIGISAIQSNYMGFGSGQTIRGTGINMNNRGSYFTLDAGHHNCLAPRKKTFHTLMATVCKGPNSIYVSSMGGDVQPQINMQILSRIIDFGITPQDAVNAPRFCYPSSIYSDSILYEENGLDIEGARKVGDRSSLMGHAQAIVAGEKVEEAFDPRGDSYEIY
ncbi:MAG: gamma-glutamyltransferase family protein [Thermoplasmata archaeon]|uniref:Gamma-glutamyltransferase family protein n=1 Tax=Candidatus Sysuiplasma superficiale TaxID=2823368 RepID=A0A8J7YR95_9ARCH|nr:gamma-glutamyltransferase family protein [Candidatus Sysuiplasma superficiale]MBX8643764.1 gamma-glutamyltransferase family protein [Candidatus Sysuiplasma superficiale]MCL4347284.1 gamma-glutamyltransferase family protein [Candidatus Thermoplasmatota archaeon]